NTKALQAAQERLQMLQAQNTAAGSATLYTGTTTAPVESYASKLNQLQLELAKLKDRYQDDHPEVKAKIREIDNFIAAGKGAAPDDHSDTARKASPTPMSPLERDIHSQTVEINGLQDEQKRIRNDIALYSARIERAPQVQQQLEERMKGYEVLKQQFNDYQGKVESARGAQTIEEAQKGEQFEVIERAVPPALPV